MKKILLFILFISFSLELISQTNKVHFDNKPYVEGEFLVQLTNEDKLDILLKNAPIEYKVEVIQYVSKPMLVWLLSFDHQVVSHEGFQSWLYSQKEVTIADYNYHIEMRSTVPNDPNFNQQWHHVNTGQTGGTVDADIDSDLAWDITTGGSTATNDDIVVCMIESGNLDHLDISPNRWVNTAEIPDNGIDDDGNGYVDDYHGWNPVSQNDDYGVGAHGTNCLGMIGAAGNNSRNVVGANWNVKLMVIGNYQLTQASVIAAYTYPLVMRKKWNESNGTQGAFVVATSASWGLDASNPVNFPLWCQFYDSLGYAGILNIGATTNSNINVDLQGDMPTSCSSIYMIGVGRTDHNDNTAGGYGVNTIEFGAPGINVLTTSGTSGTATVTGTSFSCPLTAGVVGLAYSIPCQSFMNIVKSNPRLGADLVRDALINGVDVKTQLSTRFITSGRLNAKNTLDLLMNETCTNCVITDFNIIPDKNNATIEFTSHPDIDLNKLYWRIVGSTTWQVENLGSNSFQLSGLDSCTTYECYIESNCDLEQTNSGTIVFKTIGCGNCLELPYCDSKAINPTNARFSFLSSTGVESTITNFVATDNWGKVVNSGYEYGNLVLVRSSTGNAIEGCGALINSSEISGNIAVAVRGTCDFSAKAIMAQNAGASALIIINNQTTAPAVLGGGSQASTVTIPVIMISQAQGTSLLTSLNNNEIVSGILGVQTDWIESFSFAGVTTNSGNNSGYFLSSDTPMEVTKGQTYSFTINPGYSNQNLPEYSKIWIDLNQNGTFDLNELMYDQNTFSSAPVNGNITIPSNTSSGLTRMRVQMVYQGAGKMALPTNCTNYNWGETEDYCLVVKDSVNSNLAINGLEKNSLKIYPNPAKEIINIDWNNFIEGSSISIVDVVGRELINTILESKSSNIDVSVFSTGTYIYKVINKENEVLFSGKIVVE